MTVKHSLTIMDLTKCGLRLNKLTNSVGKNSLSILNFQQVFYGGFGTYSKWRTIYGGDANPSQGVSRTFLSPLLFLHQTQLQILACWLLDLWPKLHFIPPKTKGLLSHVTRAKHGICFTKEIFFFSSHLITEYLWRLTLLRPESPSTYSIDCYF